MEIKTKTIYNSIRKETSLVVMQLKVACVLNLYWEPQHDVMIVCIC